MDVLETIRGEVDNAISEGQSFQKFKNNLEPKLRKLGWWGKQDFLDKETGEVIRTQLGSPWRLKTIYQTNMQTSYSAGRYNAHKEVSDRRPYWMYDAINDQNTRPSHRAKDNTVLRADDNWWDTNYPPNGWGCRCSVRSLSERRLKSKGLSVQDGKDVDGVASEEWAYNPGETEWKPDLRKYPKELADKFKKKMKRYVPIDTDEGDKLDVSSIQIDLVK
jgi:SPP1 gp7 family putative phage head morphogenesis protein